MAWPGGLPCAVCRDSPVCNKNAIKFPTNFSWLRKLSAFSATWAVNRIICSLMKFPPLCGARVAVLVRVSGHPGGRNRSHPTSDSAAVVEGEVRSGSPGYRLGGLTQFGGCVSGVRSGLGKSCRPWSVKAGGGAAWRPGSREGVAVGPVAVGPGGEHRPEDRGMASGGTGVPDQRRRAAGAGQGRDFPA